MRTYSIIKNIGLNGMMICALAMILSCKKFIQVDPPSTSVNGGNVYTENSNSIAVLTGLYAKVSSSAFSLDLSRLPDLSADNLTLLDLGNPWDKQYYQNSLSTTSMLSLWGDLYSYMYIVNSAIEGLNGTSSLNPEIKQHLLGEAYFMRGFFYFYLTNLYGDVPLILTTDYKVNSNIIKSPSDLIYNQIVLDLKQAQSILDEKYVDGTILKETSNRLRPNKMTATALLARVYLYKKNYPEAEIEATKIIQNSLYSVTTLNETFLKNSRETIWALQPVSDGDNTKEGEYYIFPLSGPDNHNNVCISHDLFAAFDNGDQRKSKWIGEFQAGTKSYPFPYKYKVKDGDPSNPAEYTIVFRLAEQYLIRAEAQIQQGNLENGIKDLNVLRTRSNDSSLPLEMQLKQLPLTLSKDDAIIAIEKERRSELFSEWGNRWFDLKRTGKIDAVMSTATVEKGGTWSSYKANYPIPLSEIQRNPKLTQNTGYN